jgi:hypothetical protein
VSADVKRCALLEGHRGVCAAWPRLPDSAQPKHGTRCGSLVEPRVELWRRLITGRELRDEARRRDVVTWTRLVASRHGYRGRISFERAETPGPPAVELFAILVHPAGRPRP